MKAESTEIPPKFNLLKPDGVRAQGHAADVSAVLLNDGAWYQIKKGSFKFYKVNSNTGVPYITFKPVSPEWLAGMTIECFPATVCGLAYRTAVSE